MKKSKANVYVVDDDASVRKSLKRLIGSLDFSVETFETADDFLRLPQYKRPACLILDIRLPGLNGMELQEKLLEVNKSLPIVFITGHGDIPLSVQAMKKGAVDFLQKPFKEKDLMQAIDQALERDTSSFQTETEKEEVLELLKKLTPREMEVFRWVITGMLNKQIAYEMGIGEKTVKVHRGQVMHKLKIFSVAELVRLAEKADISPADK